MAGKSAIVLYPLPLVGHLSSTVELGKLILKHHPTKFSITILITTLPPPFSTTSFIQQVSSTIPSITFHHLPTATLPADMVANASFEALAFLVPRFNNLNLQQALQTISEKSSIKALIIDFFCNPAFEVGQSLNIPIYYFFTACASGLPLLLYLPVIDQTIPVSLKDLNKEIHVPGMPPFPSSDAPVPLLDRGTGAYDNFLSTAINMCRSNGIIVNTFELLESRALKALADGVCTPNGKAPPIYCIGPLIGPSSTGNGGPGSSECIAWLDSQPSKSVVFLSFGSMGLFSRAQLVEISIALEKSGCRYLWVVRDPPKDDEGELGFPLDELDSNLSLPKGFLQRTKDKGLVVKSWVPQKEILSHDSVAGFVTHCGWNSVLEAVCAGVPMLGWPLYAEQRFNRVVLVEEMKVVLPLEMSEDGFVGADELEKRVKELMDANSASGKAVTERIMAMRDGAVASMGEGGSSLVALDKLAQTWKF